MLMHKQISFIQLLSARECVSLASFRRDWIARRCLKAPPGGVTLLTDIGERHANTSHLLKDVRQHLRHRAARKNEKGRVFPREIRRNPGAEEES